MGMQVKQCFTHEGHRVWGATVRFGSNPVTEERRQYYKTRKRARDGDISESGDIPADRIAFDPVRDRRR